MDVLSLGFICSCILFLSKISTALDTIGPSQSITNSQTLVSSDGRFELGFFRPGTYNNIYLGIWFRNIPGRTVVWVANRSSPTNDSSVELMIDGTGNLVLRGKNSSRVIWSTNSAKRARNPVARLLDSGNLVLLDGANSEDYLWQSFDYPTDTLLPGMKLGWDLTRGLDRRLVSWKSSDDPSPGYFSWEIVRQDNPEGLMWLGSTKYYRSGPWDGIGFSGAPEIRPNPVFTMNFISNNTDLYFIYNFKNKSTLARMVVNQTTNYREASTWNEATQSWVVSASVPRDKCDNYGLCGVYGNCITSDWPNCQCLDKFSPKSPEKWNSMDWTDGCVRNKPLDCGKGDGFVKYVGLKVPDATGSWINGTMNLEECRAKCLQNCSCMAYTNSDVRRRSGCAIWFGDLIDIRQFQEGGQELYIRMNSAEVEGKSSQKVKIALTSSAAIVMVLGMVIVTYLICKRKAKKKHVDETEANWQNTQKNDGQKDDLELPLFELATIAIATNKFSEKNKLGEGGFGVVYRGVMVDGLEIAVKRLSRSSGQGLNEFKTEVLLITKLQHRNLVKLLGCCIQGDEKMLVYEYMPNKSLDFFLFDQTRSNLLDWSKRYNIICGIARGLLYLHQDSILRIIHRDLKASNVLLDKDMNPKISDFGLAKTFKGDQTEGNTSRVVGTYGYMAPEYATDGLFSVKSDVFSFGILVLEIVSGKKSRGFSRPNHNQSLIGYGWKVWKEGKSLEIIDPSTIESCDLTEVLRCINISLLCTQQRPEDRPSMASVVLMLGSESSSLPQPIEPGFLKEGDPLYEKFLSRETGTFSVNGLTTSILEAR